MVSDVIHLSPSMPIAPLPLWKFHSLEFLKEFLFPQKGKEDFFLLFFNSIFFFSLPLNFMVPQTWECFSKIWSSNRRFSRCLSGFPVVCSPFTSEMLRGLWRERWKIKQLRWVCLILWMAQNFKGMSVCGNKEKEKKPGLWKKWNFLWH